MSFNIDPNAGKDQRQLQMEKMQKELEEKLASAKTADFGNLNSENAEKLQKIIEETQPQALEIEKMTAEELEAGRRANAKAETAGVQQKRQVAGFLNWMGTAVGGLFSKSEKRQTQCEMYGHDLPVSGKWDGPYPECPRCGTKIKSPDMLRKSTPSSSDVDRT